MATKTIKVLVSRLHKMREARVVGLDTVRGVDSHVAEILEIAKAFGAEETLYTQLRTDGIIPADRVGERECRPALFYWIDTGSCAR